jgi:hypothetical protein
VGDGAKRTRGLLLDEALKVLDIGRTGLSMVRSVNYIVKLGSHIDFACNPLIRKQIEAGLYLNLIVFRGAV